MIESTLIESTMIESTMIESTIMRRSPGLPSRRRYSAGFSLIELMISVVIGLIALGLATRLVVSSEVNKQTAMGGSDSMQNGALALFSIERELNQAGWGLNDPLLAGCDTVFADANGYDMLTATTSAGATVKPLGSVVIRSVNGQSDMLSINSGSSLSNAGSVGLSNGYVGGTALLIDRDPFGFNGTATMPAGGDAIAVVPDVPGSKKCAIAMVSQALPGPQNSLSIASGATNRFNSGALGVNYAATDAGRIFNLGPAPNLSFHTWSIVSGFLKLRATNLAGAEGSATNPTGQVVTDNIVALKAQYGLDTRVGTTFLPETTGMMVGTWSSTMLDADGSGTAGDAGDYARIAAVRIAVVARGRNPEKPNAAGTCTATTTAPTVLNGLTVSLAVAGDTMPWQCYRYRVFETVVPIRNSGWRPT